MKKLIIPVIAGALVLLLSSCSVKSAPVTQNSTPLTIAPAQPATLKPPPVAAIAVGNQIGNQAPAFQLKDMAGNTVSLSDFRGKPVLLNFWATW